MPDQVARKAAQQESERDYAYREFWNELSRNGDPAHIPGKIKTGFVAGWNARESALAPMRELLATILEWEEGYRTINNLSGSPDWVSRAREMLNG